MAALPENWDMKQTDEGEIVYLNKVTGETTTEHPCDEFYRNLYKEKKILKHNTQTEVKISSAIEEELQRRLKEHKEKLEKQYNEKCKEITVNIEKDKATLLNQLEEQKKEIKRKSDENLRKEKER